MARRSFHLACLCASILLGCDSETEVEEPPDYSQVVPVSGTVRVDGKPVPGVVVTFLPPKWSASNGETDANGVYHLQTAGKPGALPGTYKVAISYMVSSDGEAQGLGARSAIVPPPGMATAREKLSNEYCDLSRTTLKATVDRDGGRDFDFDVKSIAEPANPTAPRVDEAKAPEAGSSPAPAEKAK